MKKILIILPMIIITIAVFGHYPVKSEPKSDADTMPLKEHRMVKETTVNYKKTDTPYRLYGTYKEIIRQYNYAYHDTSFKIHDVRTDGMHGIFYEINEYGDTVRITYTDYTNFARRED